MSYKKKCDQNDRPSEDVVVAESSANNFLEEKWQRILNRLKLEFGEDVCNSWFSTLKPERYEENEIYLSVPTRFLKNWLESHYYDTLSSNWRKELPEIDEICIIIRSLSSGSRKESNIAATRKLSSNNASHSTTNQNNIIPLPKENYNGNSLGELGTRPEQRLTFANYITCESNQIAVAAAKQLCEPNEEGVVIFNPLYIHSSVGLGKTHLLQAIANECRNNGHQRVLYLTADKFMYSFITALKSQNSLAFKEQLNGIDILIIDDLQFLLGHHVIREFSLLLNAMIDTGRHVVMSGDSLPSDLNNLDDRSRSRISGGLVCEISQFDREARLEILKCRARQLSSNALFHIDHEIFEYLATVITTNGRDLEGALTRLIAHQRYTKSAITVDTAKSVIQDLVNAPTAKTVKIDDIQQLVAQHFKVLKQDLLSARRSRTIVRPRQVAMYLSKTLTLRSLPDIGRRFGGRDHTTVLHAVRKVEELQSIDPNFAKEVDNLRRILID